MNRRRDLCYTIYSRFEESLRSYISKELSNIFTLYSEGIPLGIIDKTYPNEAKLPETAFEFLEKTGFPDLKEICTYKKLYRFYFDDKSLSQDEFIRYMDLIYPIRCRVAHSDSLFTSIDIEEILTYTRDIYLNLRDVDDSFIEFLTNLESDPEKYTIKVPANYHIEKVSTIPNNLPTPDFYYEGGFVGRKDDIRKIKKLIEGDLHRVITISGAGGVGKTAIIQYILDDILNNPNIDFDGIIWTSAKENKLSAVGIEDIEPTIKNYEELLDKIINTMGYGIDNQSLEQKEEDVNAIFELHNRILIVIDNLETITDDNIIDFILDAHRNIKIVITSRRGLGQVERRYELNQLKQNEAVALFRQIATEKNLTSLARLSTTIINEYVNKIACYPLAIKWAIGNVALGKDINIIIDNAVNQKSDIAKFCFEHIFDSLNENTKELLCTLSMFDDPVPAGILKYVIDQTQSEFEDSLKELVLVSLVIQSQENDSQDKIITKFNLLSLTRGFVREQLDGKSDLKRRIQEKIRSVEATVEEADRAKKHYKHSLSDFGATTEEEQIAALLANTAFQKYQMGRYPEAVEHYKRAIEIAPSLPSLYRNWAIMESNEGHPVEADKLMRKASQLNPQDSQIWHVWGNMRRKENKIKDALKNYERAVSISPDDPIILNAYGLALSRSGEYETAEKIFLKALEYTMKVDGHNTRRPTIINMCSLADNYRRWAEEITKRAPIHTEEEISLIKDKLGKSLDFCNKAIMLDKNDNKTIDIQRKTLFEIAHHIKTYENDLDAIKPFKYFVSSSAKRWQEIKHSALATKEIVKIYYKHNMDNEAIIFLTPSILRIAKKFNPSISNEISDLFNKLVPGDKISGKIVKIVENKGYSIIESLTDREKTYLGHFKSFSSPDIEELTVLLQGKEVTFSPEFNKKLNRYEAVNITVF